MAAAALIGPLAWEPPYARDTALKRKRKKESKKARKKERKKKRKKRKEGRQTGVGRAEVGMAATEMKEGFQVLVMTWPKGCPQDPLPEVGGGHAH